MINNIIYIEFLIVNSIVLYLICLSTYMSSVDKYMSSLDKYMLSVDKYMSSVDKYRCKPLVLVTLNCIKTADIGRNTL